MKDRGSWFLRSVFLCVVPGVLFLASCRQNKELPPSADVVSTWTRSVYGKEFVLKEFRKSKGSEDWGKVLWGGDYNPRNGSEYGFAIMQIAHGTSIFHSSHDELIRSRGQIFKRPLANGQTLYIRIFFFSKVSDLYVAYTFEKEDKPHLILLQSVPAQTGLPEGVSSVDDLAAVYEKAMLYLEEK